MKMQFMVGLGVNDRTLIPITSSYRNNSPYTLKVKVLCIVHTTNSIICALCLKHRTFNRVFLSVFKCEGTDMPIICKPDVPSLLLCYIYDFAAVRYFINPQNISEQEQCPTPSLSEKREKERGMRLQCDHGD